MVRSRWGSRRSSSPLPRSVSSSVGRVRPRGVCGHQSCCTGRGTPTEAQDGLTTHIVKGSQVVAHLVPANAKIIDDTNLLTAMLQALAEQQAIDAAATDWRDGRLWHAGDTVGRMLAWTWRTDGHIFMKTFAHYHGALQKAVGQTVDVDALRRGLDTALSVSLSDAEIAELHRDIDARYHEYYYGQYDAPLPRDPRGTGTAKDSSR
jgi:hypothetical protein